MMCCFQLRAVELQAEEEHAEKVKLQREKRDFERKIQTLSEQMQSVDRGWRL